MTSRSISSTLFIIFIFSSVAAAAPPPLGKWMALGPFDAEDAETTVSVDIAAPLAGERPVVWRNGEPKLWHGATEDANGLLRVRRLSAPLASAPRFVFLSSEIQASQETRIVLSLSGEGAFSIWLNGRAMADENWAPPGADRFLKPVTLEKGRNTLVVRSVAPTDAGAPWTVRARLLERAAIQGDQARYPFWRFATAPPWTPDNPPKWMRWGDPIIEAFIGAAPAPWVIETYWDGESTTPSKMNAATGQAVELKPPARINKSKAAILNFRLGPDNATSISLVLGKRTDLSVYTTAQAAAASSISEERNRSDLRAALAALDRRPGQGGVWTKSDRAIEGSLRFFSLNAGKKVAPPDGWAYLAAAPSRKGDKSAPYALFTPPKNAAIETMPLVILPALGQTGATRIVFENPALWAAALNGRRLLAVEDTSGDGARSIEAIRRDVASRVAVDARRVSLLALEDAVDAALGQTVERPGIYARVAVIDGVWSEPVGEWKERLEKIAPQPALSITRGEDRAKLIRDAFDFFQTVSPPANPGRWAFSGYPDGEALGWIRLAESLDRALPSALSVTRVSTNSLNIESRNVARFDIALKDLDNLQAARPIILNIQYEDGSRKLKIIGPKLPEMVSATLIEKSNGSRFWQAEEVTSKRSETPLEPLGVMETGSETSEDAVARLLARAVRRSGNGTVGLVARTDARGELAPGDLFAYDVASRVRDARLSSASLPTAEVIRALEYDYAGARLLTSDGLGGLLSGSGASILDSTALDAAENVTVTGSRNLIERLFPAHKAHLHDLKAGQREVFLRFIEAEEIVVPPAPDIRSLPRKFAKQKKFKNES